MSQNQQIEETEPNAETSPEREASARAEPEDPEATPSQRKEYESENEMKEAKSEIGYEEEEPMDAENDEEIVQDDMQE